MRMSFLLDENIAASLADKLDKAGHDVERVVDVSELGEGVNDTMICEYAAQEGRLIVTSDDDFVEMPADSHRGVFYVPDQSLPSHELYHPARYRSVPQPGGNENSDVHYGKSRRKPPLQRGEDVKKDWL